jgi:hypothetical protein
MNKQETLIYLLNLWSIKSHMGDKELVEYFKILCKFPDYFNILAPVQNGDSFVYTIEWKDKFKEDIHLYLK